MFLYYSLLVIKTEVVFTSTQASRGKTDTAKDFHYEPQCGEIGYAKRRQEHKLLKCTAVHTLFSGLIDDISIYS